MSEIPIHNQDPDFEGMVRVIDIPRATPTWRMVLFLAWPVLAQQLLTFSVLLSDSFLAGHFQPVSAQERAEAVGSSFIGLLICVTNGQKPGMGTYVAGAVPWQLAEQITSQHAAYQAAQTTAHYLAWFISSYTVLVSVGSTALVSRYIGAGDRQAAIRVTNQSILLAILLGLFGTVAGLAGLPHLVDLLQLKGEASLLAISYLHPLFALLVFQVIESAGIACLVGAGDTRTGFWVLGGVAILNLPLAWLLFLGTGKWQGLGFVGIALGTALSQTIGGLTVLLVLIIGRAGLRLRKSLFKPDLEVIRRLLRVSIPAGVDSLSIVVGQFWFLSIVNRLGYAASSAHGIALRWEALGYLSGAAFGTAAMTLVGQNLGARRPQEAALSGWLAFWLGCLMMCAMGAIFFVLANPMFRLFCSHHDQAAIVEAGVPVLRLVAFAMPPLACCMIFTYALRGAGDTRVPVLFTWIGFLGVRIPLAYWLTADRIDMGFFGTWKGLSLGLFGAWLAMFADLTIRGAFFLHRFASGRWQATRV